MLTEIHKQDKWWAKLLHECFICLCRYLFDKQKSQMNILSVHVNAQALLNALRQGTVDKHYYVMKGVAHCGYVMIAKEIICLTIVSQ